MLLILGRQNNDQNDGKRDHYESISARCGQELHPALSGPCRCRDLGVPPSTRDDRAHPLTPRRAACGQRSRCSPVHHRLFWCTEHAYRATAHAGAQTPKDDRFAKRWNCCRSTRAASSGWGVPGGCSIHRVGCPRSTTAAESVAHWYVSAARNDNCDAGRRGNEWVNRHP